MQDIVWEEYLSDTQKGILTAWRKAAFPTAKDLGMQHRQAVKSILHSEEVIAFLRSEDTTGLDTATAQPWLLIVFRVWLSMLLRY